MKKYRDRLGCRIIAIILVIVCGMTAFASGMASLFTYHMGLYTTSLNKILQDKQKNAQTINSMIIYDHRRKIKKNDWALPNTNMEYGIIQAADLEDIDISDPSVYWNYHFNSTKPTEDSYTISYNTDSDYAYSNKVIPSLTGSGIYNAHLSEDDTLSSGLVPVKKLSYNSEDGIFYFTTTSYSYPVKTIGVDSVRATMKEIPVTEWEVSEEYPGEYFANRDQQEDLVYFQLDEKTKKYVSVSGNYENLDTSQYKKWQTVTLDTFSTTGSYIQTDKSENLLPENKEHTETTLISPLEFDYYAEEGIHYNGLEYNNNSMKWECEYVTMASYTIKNEAYAKNTYWIISNVKPMSEWITDSDLIAKQHYILSNLYQYRYLSLILTVGMTIITLLAIVFCLYSAGFHQIKPGDSRIFCGKENNVLLTWQQKTPLELYILVLGGAFLICTSMLFDGIENLIYGNISLLPALVSSGIFSLLALCSGLILCMHIAHQIHGRILGRYSLCYRLFLPCRKGLKQTATILRQHTSLVCKGVLVLAGISLIEFIIILIFRYNGLGLLITWGWIKLLEFVLVIFMLIQMKTLQQGSAELAEGNISHRLNTDKMFWEFKKHGDNLNKINEGIAIALDERMKSEHFKTELITNVSHDIKTPLTSIINYVDLLQKQGISETEEKEYLEVLDRQSKRLKKLIEDLIKASKASTGNLSVQLEPCNLDILLTQTVGEFEEKLFAAELTLITDTSQKGIYIQADSRHLWRVFDNLMNNICKYAQPGTRVYINQEVENDKVYIIFRNTSREALNISGEELLERFVRGDSSRNTEGNGLGLSIAQSLTELMGGKLKIHVDGDLFKVIIIFSL